MVAKNEGLEEVVEEVQGGWKDRQAFVSIVAFALAREGSMDPM